jgi:hypothetical protein
MNGPSVSAGGFFVLGAYRAFYKLDQGGAPIVLHLIMLPCCTIATHKLHPNWALVYKDSRDPDIDREVLPNLQEITQ